LYKPDTWAGISIALGASILTLVGIYYIYSDK
jgi:hypothetical protein